MKKIPLMILGAVSIVLSRATFLLIDDPEGPNLLIVMVLAVIIYAFCLAVYFFYSRIVAKWING